MVTPVAVTAAKVTQLKDAMVRHIEEALAQRGGRIEGPKNAGALLDIIRTRFARE